MKRRTLFKTAALAVFGNAMRRLARAQSGPLSTGQMETLAAIAAVVLPSTLGDGGQQKAVAAFVAWLDGYKAGVPMSYGYGGQLKASVVPPSPALRYPAQFSRLEELAKTWGASFAALSVADRRAVVDAALAEAKVMRLPARPDGQHIASDLLSHFYNSSEGNDFVFEAAIRVSSCRGLSDSAARPSSIG